MQPGNRGHSTGAHPMAHGRGEKTDPKAERQKATRHRAVKPPSRLPRPRTTEVRSEAGPGGRLPPHHTSALSGPRSIPCRRTLRAAPIARSDFFDSAQESAAWTVACRPLHMRRYHVSDSAISQPPSGTQAQDFPERHTCSLPPMNAALTARREIRHRVGPLSSVTGYGAGHRSIKRAMLTSGPAGHHGAEEGKRWAEKVRTAGAFPGEAAAPSLPARPGHPGLPCGGRHGTPGRRHRRSGAVRPGTRTRTGRRRRRPHARPAHGGRASRIAAPAGLPEARGPRPELRCPGPVSPARTQP